jgi:hypothetical protein
VQLAVADAMQVIDFLAAPGLRLPMVPVHTFPQQHFPAANLAGPQTSILCGAFGVITLLHGGKFFFPEFLLRFLPHFPLPHGHAVNEGEHLRQPNRGFAELHCPVFADEYHPKFISRDLEAPAQIFGCLPAQDTLSHPALTSAHYGKDEKIPVSGASPLLL